MYLNVEYIRKCVQEIIKYMAINIVWLENRLICFFFYPVQSCLGTKKENEEHLFKIQL